MYRLAKGETLWHIYAVEYYLAVKKNELEFLLWLSRLRTQHSVQEDATSIPGLTQWVKDWYYHKLQHRSQMQLRSGVAVAVAKAAAADSASSLRNFYMLSVWVQKER